MRDIRAHIQVFLVPEASGVLSPGKELAAWAWAHEPFSSLLSDAFCNDHPMGRKNCICMDGSIPAPSDAAFLRYERGCLGDLLMGMVDGMSSQSWCIISNGRYRSRPDLTRCQQILNDPEEHALCVSSDPGLQAGSEQVIFASEDTLAGFRTYCRNVDVPCSIGNEHCEHVFVRAGVLGAICRSRDSLADLGSLAAALREEFPRMSAMRCGGTRYDLNEPLQFARFMTDLLAADDLHIPQGYSVNRRGVTTLAGGVRICGPVLIGNNVALGEKALITGPTIISDGASVLSGTAVVSSFIGESSCQRGDVYHRLRLGADCDHDISGQSSDCHDGGSRTVFKKVEPLSYGGFWKRAIDIVAALCAITVLFPIVPIIAVAIKLNSRGPVFFRHRRQGLHGRIFHCLKFRTMITGADELQQRLRAFNEIVGPQFKMDDDPRVTSVGRYLRSSFLDEVPQFLNVLHGTMSVVGPRPSPPRENSACPPWHDARLSVRPGITGLWQVCRTRGRLQDFQEWIYYDTRYVRDISFRQDAWICWRTLIKFMRAIVKQS
jgi:lipopolysaccharide/colanic/teichoic acid biosynthesis glycosyltransferase